MRCLNEREVELYRKNGFLAVEDLLDARDVVVWRTSVEEAIAERVDSYLPPGESYDPEVVKVEQENESSLYNRQQLWRTNKKVKDLLTSPALGEMLARLEGVDGIRLLEDRALQKNPGNLPTPWHFDIDYFPCADRHGINIWVALDDATVANGCLWYLPGTHAREEIGDSPWESGNLVAVIEANPRFADVQPVPAPVPAGGVVFHNCMTYHAAGANLTMTRRLAMTAAYIPDGAVFDGTQDCFSDEQMSRLSVGRPLDDEDITPKVWP